MASLFDRANFGILNDNPSVVLPLLVRWVIRRCCDDLRADADLTVTTGELSWIPSCSHSSFFCSPLQGSRSQFSQLFTRIHSVPNIRVAVSRSSPNNVFVFFFGIAFKQPWKNKKDVQASLLPKVRRTTNEKAVRPKWVSFLVTTVVLFPYDCRILLESESSLTETLDCSTASFSKRFPPTKPCIHIGAPDILTLHFLEAFISRGFFEPWFPEAFWVNKLAAGFDNRVLGLMIHSRAEYSARGYFSALPIPTSAMEYHWCIIIFHHYHLSFPIFWMRLGAFLLIICSDSVPDRPLNTDLVTLDNDLADAGHRYG